MTCVHTHIYIYIKINCHRQNRQQLFVRDMLCGMCNDVECMIDHDDVLRVSPPESSSIFSRFFSTEYGGSCVNWKGGVVGSALSRPRLRLN